MRDIFPLIRVHSLTKMRFAWHFFVVEAEEEEENVTSFLKLLLHKFSLLLLKLRV